MNNILLNNGVKIPQIGFGTWKAPTSEVTINAVKTAIENGYTHIDCASVYGNEKEVGQGIIASNISRDKLFITGKLWNDVRGYDETITAFNQTLNDLAIDYLDLYFHNFGYQTLEFKIPNLTSRKYFNFIQMELVNYHTNNRLITAEIIEDIKSRFRTGVTLFHYNETDLVKIDTQKQYENFERKFETTQLIQVFQYNSQIDDYPTQIVFNTPVETWGNYTLFIQGFITQIEIPATEIGDGEDIINNNQIILTIDQNNDLRFGNINFGYFDPEIDAVIILNN